MRYRRLIDGEPSFGKGNLDFIEGVNAVAQAITTRLKLFKGEWWENVNDGLPVMSDIIGYGNKNMNKREGLVTERILGTKLGEVSLVTSMSDVQSTISSERKFTYTGVAVSLYGPITVSIGG